MTAAVHQAGRPKVILWTREGGREDISSFVLAFNTVETFQPPQRFTLTLAAPQGGQAPGNLRYVDRLSRQLRPNSVVSIGWDEPGDLFLGLVDNVSRSTPRSGGEALSVSLSVSGCDLVGKALSRDNVLLSLLTETASPAFFDHLRKVLGPNHPMLLGIASALGPITAIGPDRGVNLFTGKTVAEVVAWILTQIPAMTFPTLQATIGGSGRIGDYVTTDAVTTWNNQRVYSEAPSTFAGNLLGFVRAVVDTDFYEVFTTSVPNGTDLPTGVLVVRPKPYDDPILKVALIKEDPGIDWQRLKTRIDGKIAHIIKNDDIHVENVSWGDEQAWAYYTVSSAHDLIGNPEQANMGLGYPLVDTYNAVTFGAASYEARTILVAGDVTQQVDQLVDFTAEIPLVVRELRNRLFNWYRWNPWFLNGQATITGRPKVRVGDPVQFVDWRTPLGIEPGVRAYATSVTQAWSLGGIYTTAVSFTRGYNALYVDAIKTLIAQDAAKYGVTPAHAAVS